MKIGILLDRLAEGSYTKIAIKEVKHLMELGHDARIVVLMRGSKREYRYDDIIKDIPVEFLSDRYSNIFKFSFKFPFFSFFSFFHVTSPLIAPLSVKPREYDIFISHGTYTSFTAITLYKFCQIPYIAFIHDPISYILPKVYSKDLLRYAFPIISPLGKYLDKLIVRNSSLTLTQGSVHKGRLEELKEGKIETLPFSCDPVDQLPDKRGDFFLAITKWDKGKSPSFLLKVLKLMSNREARLVVAGFWTDRNLLKKFENEVKKERLEERVTVLGTVDEEKLKKLYLTSRALMHPIIEAFGMTVLEAAAHGCPSIIPKGSGVTDLLTHMESGLFPEEGNLDEFVAHADRLMNDEQYAWKLGKNAWEKSRKHSWGEHAKKLNQIIKNYFPGEYAHAR